MWNFSLVNLSFKIFSPFSNIKWNFTKFLINKEGIPVQRYSPQTKPSVSIFIFIQWLAMSTKHLSNFNKDRDSNKPQKFWTDICQIWIDPFLP